jgi:hypothetical protein
VIRVAPLAAPFRAGGDEVMMETESVRVRARQVFLGKNGHRFLSYFLKWHESAHP